MSMGRQYLTSNIVCLYLRLPCAQSRSSYGSFLMTIWHSLLQKLYQIQLSESATPLQLLWSGPTCFATSISCWLRRGWLEQATTASTTTTTTTTTSKKHNSNISCWLRRGWPEQATTASTARKKQTNKQTTTITKAQEQYLLLFETWAKQHQQQHLQTSGSLESFD